MRIIDLDASSWTDTLDFIEGILAALGAPDRHGRNLNALLDSMIWNREINTLQPPYRIIVHDTARLPEDVKDSISLICQYLALDRQEHIEQYGEDVDVSMEIVS